MSQHGQSEQRCGSFVGLRDEALLVEGHDAGMHALQHLRVVAFLVDGLLTGAVQHVADAVQRLGSGAVLTPAAPLRERKAEVAPRDGIGEEL